MKFSYNKDSNLSKNSLNTTEFDFLYFTQPAHDVVTTLGFGCILVATSDNVVKTLCFQRRYYNQKLALLQRCVFDVGFPTWY